MAQISGVGQSACSRKQLTKPAGHRLEVILITIATGLAVPHRHVFGMVLQSGEIRRQRADDVESCDLMLGYLFTLTGRSGVPALELFHIYGLHI